ncbi:hypothetical protein WN944_004037 [Citrus x changshan-huyou]|uniref:Uncharacterized protein n=1 Tax=Citrus x changshan-huyou TaxID=2935761 RepID=A0AAP0M366_9ROSI
MSDLKAIADCMISAGYGKECWGRDEREGYFGLKGFFMANANTHSTEWAYGQIHILRIAPTGKYTFYGMGLRANTHSTEWAYGQIHILRANIHSTKCAYGQIYAFYGMRLRAECTYGQNVAKSILFTPVTKTMPRVMMTPPHHGSNCPYKDQDSPFKAVEALTPRTSGTATSTQKQNTETACTARKDLDTVITHID